MAANTADELTQKNHTTAAERAPLETCIKAIKVVRIGRYQPTEKNPAAFIILSPLVWYPQ